MTTDVSTAPVPMTKEELEHRFVLLRELWQEGTSFESSMTKIVSHPAYRAIIALGPDVVPILIEDLRNDPSWWMKALRELTGADPVTPDMCGKVVAMSKAWVDWYDRAEAHLDFNNSCHAGAM